MVLWLIQCVFELYLLMVVLCVLLRSARADYYNPIVQVIVRLTQPILKPFRIMFPLGTWDVGGFVGAVCVKCVELVVLLLLSQLPVGVVGVLVISIAGVLMMMCNIWFYAIIIYAIVSWFRPTNMAALHVIDRLTSPVLNLIRRFLPSFGRLDFSPLIFLIAIQLVNAFLLGPLMGMGVMLLHG